jgi:hypothetical protein
MIRPFKHFTPFIDISLGSIRLNILHVDYTFIPLACAGSSHKKEPDALEPVEDFFPQERPLRGRNLKHCCIFSSLGKKLIVDCRNQTNLNKIVEQMNKNIKIQSKIASFSHFG